MTGNGIDDTIMAQAEKLTTENKKRMERQKEKEEAALQKLSEMGFQDTVLSTSVLRMCNYDVDKAVEQLLSNLPSGAAQAGVAHSGNQQQQQRQQEGDKQPEIQQLSTNPPNGDATVGEAHTKYTHFSYETLSAATNSFNDAHLVGGGAFGKVFRCRLQGMGLEVAVKVFVAEDGTGTQSADAFKQEAQELSRHPHPNIVHMFGASTDGPHLCLITMYMAGGSAQSRLADAVPLSWRERLVVAEGCIQALLFLHTHLNKVHRDVKPLNILLDKPLRAGRAVLCDFGLIRTMQTRSGKTEKTATAVGTVTFMSHEALQGKITTKMDIYAFGVTLLVLIAGKPAEGADGDASRQNLVMEMEDALDDLVDGDSAAAITYLDTRITSPTPPVADVETLLRLASQCLHHKHKERPDAALLLDSLKKLLEAAEAQEVANSLGAMSVFTSDRQHWVSKQQQGLDKDKLFAVDVSTQSDEFDAIAARFFQTMPDASIDRLERVENGYVHESFKLQVSTLAKQMGADWDSTTMRQMLFHGTEAVDPIVNAEDGHAFLPLLSGTSTGAIFGDGCYFARDSKYSDDYANTLPSGQKQMLVVDVLVGRWSLGQKNMKMPPLLPGEKYRRFNSLVNKVDNPSIFVVQHSNQAYPAYLITYHH